VADNLEYPPAGVPVDSLEYPLAGVLLDILEYAVPSGVAGLDRVDCGATGSSELLVDIGGFFNVRGGVKCSEGS